MRCGRVSVLAPLAIALVAVSFGSQAVAAGVAPVTYGTLSNFDAINDTGQPCNGFEIELEGISPGDVVYTFGDTGGPTPVLYIRYGKPTILRNAAGTGTIVRYASPYDSISKTFTQATPAAIPVRITVEAPRYSRRISKLV